MVNYFKSLNVHTIQHTYNLLKEDKINIRVIYSKKARENASWPIKIP